MRRRRVGGRGIFRATAVCAVVGVSVCVSSNTLTAALTRRRGSRVVRAKRENDKLRNVGLNVRQRRVLCSMSIAHIAKESNAQSCFAAKKHGYVYNGHRNGKMALQTQHDIEKPFRKYPLRKKCEN
ncbi:Hypothetical protein CINCED_3A022131 [Cinara cedri]|uniref:Uncharacterized protein n=1 Tax=Cinara cedri TaxID=506608 RepID=A0A5E4N6E1_9HEMI|nr:Hypothetical protein CINCED_3A022131 [Cinara cedri]